jgi:aldehyde:ferredoxin oxidoreductase
MFGWNGRLLYINLNTGKSIESSFHEDFALRFLGGRGFAVKILWDSLRPGTDPLSPENKLILAAGPLSGFPLPNSGKLVVASKSPLTGGYGDGNLGTFAAIHMRKAGYDAIIVEGKAEKPSFIYIKDKTVELLSAEELWGLSSFEAEARLRKIYGRAAGIVSIGQGGESLVKFACIVSQEGRAGGRPGMGAVMGSKNLKAIVIDGSGELNAANPQELKQQGIAGYREILAKPKYEFWKRQGTLSTVEWANEQGVLPTCNYQEGTFAEAEKIGGFAAEALKISNRGCPNCNMTCGNVVRDAEGQESELDYENIAMLGSNIGLGNIEQVSVLNRFADELGLDAISLGNVLGFAMEASEKGLIKEKISWGDFQKTKNLAEAIALRQGIGDVLANGVLEAAAKIGGNSTNWAMHIKGLEISAYDCHTAPGMALAYATSPIGAHHKDAWVLAWETAHDRFSYGQEKVNHLIDTQNIRGMFECLGVCRFPLVNMGLEQEWYPKYVHLATGKNLTWEDLKTVSERIFNLMRAFWIREYKNWDTKLDTPPGRWFDEPLTLGQYKGEKLNRSKFEAMLQSYYSQRGWDEKGIPKKETLEKLDLPEVAQQLNLL